MIVNRLKHLLGAGSALVSTLVLWAMPASVQAEWALNLQRPVTEIARVQYDLHMLIMYIVTVIGVIVFAVMFYSIVKFRKSKGAQPAKFSHSTKAEVIWTVIPTLILIVMAVPSTKALLLMEDTTESDMVVKVTGYQWGWHYDYMEDNVDFFSKLTTPQSQITGSEAKGENYLLEVDNHMVIPVGKKVRILLTARDVIHAWWVPQLGGKKTPFPVSSTRCGSVRMRQARFGDSAQNCAARITAICPSWWMWWRKPSTRLGWPASETAVKPGLTHPYRSLKEF